MAQAIAYRDHTFGIVELNQGAPATTGTRVTPSSAFVDTSISSTASQQIPVDGFISINKNIQELRPNRANSFRMPYYRDSENNNKGIAPTFSWNSALTLDHADLIFAGLFQRTVETATASKFEKTFQWPVAGAAWALTGGTYGYPEFADDEGYFFGFIGNSPVSVHDFGILSCVPMSATFTCAPAENHGRLYCVSNWAGLLTQEYVTNTAPTAYLTPYYWTFPDMNVTVNSTAVTCYGISLTVTPGFKMIPAPGDSCTDIAMVPHEVRGHIDILWDIVARTYFSSYESDLGTIAIRIYWGSGATPAATLNDLEFTCQAKLMNVEDLGDEERVVRIPFQCVYDTAGYDCKIQIVNGLDRGWQSA